MKDGIKLLEKELDILERKQLQWDDNPLKQQNIDKWVVKSNILFWKRQLVENEINKILIKNHLKENELKL